jgi:hypothetical protein
MEKMPMEDLEALVVPCFPEPTRQEKNLWFSPGDKEKAIYSYMCRTKLSVVTARIVFKYLS